MGTRMPKAEQESRSAHGRAVKKRRTTRNHVSCTLEVTYAFKNLKNSQSFENLNDADIISMPMFATCKVKMERIILFMRNRESAFVFRRRVQSEVL